MNIAPSWYFVARTDALQPAGPSLEQVIADRVLVLERGADGELHGRLAGRSLPLCERGPVVLAWLGSDAPRFEVQGFCCDGWLPMRWFHLDLETTPEAVMRDLADVEHFESVHGYANIEVEQELSYVGYSCETRLRFGWDMGVGAAYIPARFVSRVDGLGVQRTEVVSLSGRMRSRHLVMPTPRLGRVTRVHAGYSVRVNGARGALARTEARTYLGYLGWAFRRDLARDAELWTGRSAYRAAPSEVLRRYEGWCGQFAAGAAS